MSETIIVGKVWANQAAARENENASLRLEIQSLRDRLKSARKAALEEAGKFMREVAQAKADNCRGGLGSMFATQSVSDIEALSWRVQKLEEQK